MSSSVNTTQNKRNNRYLKITIHDNDFTNSLEQVAHTLNRIFSTIGKYPEEDELPLLKEYIESLWFSIDNIWQIMPDMVICHHIIPKMVSYVHMTQKRK